LPASLNPVWLPIPTEGEERKRGCIHQRVHWRKKRKHLPDRTVDRAKNSNPRRLQIGNGRKKKKEKRPPRSTVIGKSEWKKKCDLGGSAFVPFGRGDGRSAKKPTCEALSAADRRRERRRQSAIDSSSRFTGKRGNCRSLDPPAVVSTEQWKGTCSSHHPLTMEIVDNRLFVV